MHGSFQRQLVGTFLFALFAAMTLWWVRHMIWAPLQEAQDSIHHWREMAASLHPGGARYSATPLSSSSRP